MSEENLLLRRRVSAWTRKLYAEKGFPTQARMAAVMGTDPGHFSTVFNGIGEAGLDFVYKLSTVFSERMDDICKIDPDPKYFPPATVPKRGRGRPPKEQR